MRYLIFLLVTILASAKVISAPVVGDTQGKVERIVLRPATNEVHVLRIYLGSVDQDRFRCISNQGYVEVTDADPLVTTEQFKMILSIAMSAQMADKTLAIDSTVSGSPCSQGVMATLVN